MEADQEANPQAQTNGTVHGMASTSGAHAAASADYQTYMACVLGRGPGTRDMDCQICILEFEADDQTATHMACNNTFHKSCFDTWAQTKTDDDVAITCPKCRAILRRAADAPVSTRHRRSSDDSSDDDDDHSSLDSQVSEHFGGWGGDPWRPGGRASNIRLNSIPDLDHTRTYNNSRLQNRERSWADDTYVFEIPPDVYHRAIAQELPRRSDRWAHANSRMTEQEVPVSETYMDDDSWQRFQYQTRDWEVKRYQVYWAPPDWNIDFFLLPEYPATNSSNMTRLRAMVDRMVSQERIEWLAADDASRNGQT